MDELTNPCKLERKGGGIKMTTIVNPAELELIQEYERYHLARYQGNLGIWKITREVDWDASFKLPADAPLVYTGNMEAALLDDDCNHLLDPEWYGLFECRVENLKMEAASWA